MKVKVLEVDQWTSTGNVEKFSFKDFDLSKVKGGDSEAVKLISAAKVQVKEVEESAEPPIGHVWYREGSKGKLKKWKSNFDSSG